MADVSINQQEVARMMRAIQAEFDKHPIRIPITGDPGDLMSASAVGNTTIVNGPVIHGDVNGAQLAWNNNTVHQNQNHTEQISQGFEAIAQAVAKTLEQLPAAGLDDEDRREAEAAANDVLSEVTQPEPDRRKIRRALAMLRGILTPLAIGAAKGEAAGVQDWAHTAIDQLSRHL
jgi:hypothetical protein